MKALLFAVLMSGTMFAQYAGPKTVYILPMAGGLDQYLAQWLTRDHVMTVVADPKAAEVFMTDTLGEAFESRLKQFTPADKSKTNDDSPHAFHTSKAKGTIFIVDAKSHHVLWSEHHKPAKSNTDRDLNRAAEQIAREITAPEKTSAK